MKSETEHTQISTLQSSTSHARWTHGVIAAAAVWAFCASYSITSQAAFLAATPSALQAQATKSVWDGVYNEVQATRGEKSYLQECSPCHSENLTGGEMAPALVGETFMTDWGGLTVGDLFERVRVSMPQDSPGRLSRPVYADILAHILRSNKFPAGEKELDPDTAVLKQILIEIKPAGK